MKRALIVLFLLMFSTVTVAQTRKSAPAKKAPQSVHSKRKAQVREINSRRIKQPLHPSRKRAILKPPTPGKRSAPQRGIRKRK